MKNRNILHGRVIVDYTGRNQSVLIPHWSVLVGRGCAVVNAQLSCTEILHPKANILELYTINLAVVL